MEELLRHYHDRVRHIAERMLGNRADAADATQEALIAIAKGIGRFDGRSAFSTWAYRVTTNACLDEIRRRARRPVPVDEISDRPTGVGNDPGTETVLDRMVLDSALARVPVEFRTALVLRDVCDLEYADIAEVLDIPPGTVRSRIARGRAHLANSLRGNQTTEPERPNER